MDSRRALLGVVIPADYSRNLLAGDSEAQVQLLLDGSDSNTASIAPGYAEGIVQTYAARIRGDAQSMRAGQHAARGRRAREVRVWYNPDLVSRNFIVPGLIAVIMMIITGNLTSLTIAREWENGTMEQLLSTPVRPVGNGAGQAGRLLSAGLDGHGDLHVRRHLCCLTCRFKGSLLLLTDFQLAFFCSARCARASAVSATFRTQLMAYQMGTLTSFLPAFLLSGFIYSISNMPRIIQAIALFVPARYFINIIEGRVPERHRPGIAVARLPAADAATES